MALSVASSSFSSFPKRELWRKSLPEKIGKWLQPKQSRLSATKGVSSVCEPHRPLWLGGSSSTPEWLDGKEVHRRSFPEKITMWLQPKRSRLNATKSVSSICEPLPPDRPLWFPGSSPPEWLDGSLPGDFGFDPLGLGSDPELLKWFAQAELMHGRWAMLAVSGILIPEWLESLGFIENFSWYDAGAREYFADPKTLLFVQLVLMGWVEGRRWADFLNPGCVDIEPTLPHKTKPKPDVGYPGGLWFDPLMWGRGSPEPVMVLRTKEIKNGRLAMLAFVGFCFQAVYTGQGPFENLAAHIADPGHCNIFSAFRMQ